MKAIFKKIIRKIIPLSVLNLLIKRRYNRFINIKDDIGQKTFKMYLRDDSFMENIILSKGLYGEWEKESLKIWAELSKKSQIIIDIGANSGIYSMLAQSNNAEAKIIAIEPVGINFMILTKNIKKNNFPIKLERVALSDSEGTAKMFILKNKLNYMTCVNDNRYATDPKLQDDAEVVEIEVTLKPFTYIIEKHDLNRIDLIKIDVEGHEPKVVNAMLPYLEEYKPNILIEIIGDNNAEILDRMFQKIGYKYISIDEINKSVVVDKLWDNNHHNFLICGECEIEYLKSKQLVNE